MHSELAIRITIALPGSPRYIDSRAGRADDSGMHRYTYRQTNAPIIGLLIRSSGSVSSFDRVMPCVL